MREGKEERERVGSSHVTGGEKQLVQFDSGVLQIKSCGTPFVLLFSFPLHFSSFSSASVPRLHRSQPVVCPLCLLVFASLVLLYCFINTHHFLHQRSFFATTLN